MKTKISINGEDFEVELSEQSKDFLIDHFRQMDKLLKAVEKNKKIKRTGYERVDLGEEYFTDVNGEIYYFEENYSCDKEYEAANYYSDETVAENNARADMLMRRVRRFSVEHREHELDWKDRGQKKYSIYFDHEAESLLIDEMHVIQDFGKMYFDSKETAKAAIEEFKDELIWYLTEYKDCI